MTDDGGETAQRRADEAGDRARVLRDHVDAVRAGAETLHGTSPHELRTARQRAGWATMRLRNALEASADAHDRAARAFDAQVRLSGDPDGALNDRAVDHRRMAVVDRDRAAAMEIPGEGTSEAGTPGAPAPA